MDVSSARYLLYFDLEADSQKEEKWADILMVITWDLGLACSRSQLHVP
jgi:hypothetical protein